MSKKNKNKNSSANKNSTLKDELLNQKLEDKNILKENQKTLKELIAPAGIDVMNPNHIEIISTMSKYARSFFVSTLPRMCTFPSLFENMYNFDDINTCILRIELTSGILFSNGTRYEIDFT